jgi:hypothetical protein
MGAVMGKSLGYILHLANTQIGTVGLQEHAVLDLDIDDIMSLNTISQGVTLQFQNAGKDIDPNLVADGAIPSAFKSED